LAGAAKNGRIAGHQREAAQVRQIIHEPCRLARRAGNVHAKADFSGGRGWSHRFDKFMKLAGAGAKEAVLFCKKEPKNLFLLGV
jgi:hypothetical protein